MSEIEAIIAGDGYIEAIYTGRALRGFPKLEEQMGQVLAACEKYQVSRVLNNYAEVEYEMESDILAEHKMAEYLAQPHLAFITWAFLLPKASETSRIHVENVAVNRGVRLRAFLDRDEAIEWLTNDGRN